MSLFSGIKFSAAAEATASASGSLTATASASKVQPAPEPTAAPPPAPVKPEAAPAPTWSAALSLAPRKPKAKPVARTTYIPPPPEVVGAAADIIRSASPKLIEREHQALGPDGEKLAKAPAMTLVAAPKKSGKGGRNRKGRKIKVKEAQKQERGNGQSVKALKRKAKRRAETVFQAFDPDEPYDPNRPNDLAEYQAYRKREREERRQRLIESKKRKLAGGRSSDESDSDESSDEDVVRRDAPRMFAPPRNYSPPPPPPDTIPAPAPPSPFTPAPPPVIQAASGDDAYARRLAMSTAATGDDAYARRMALSQAGPSAAPVQSASLGPQPTLGPRPTFAPSQPAPPSFTPAAQPLAPTTSSNKTDDPEAFAKLLEQRKAAAAAVAARLASMMANRPAAPAPAVEEEDLGGTFAEKMMRKWGHKEGTGLGADGTGIVHALSAEHANQPKATKRNKFKPGKWTQAPNAMGKIVNLNADERARAERETKGESSRIVCLLGVVDGPDSVDDELADEIGEECNNLGVVERVVLHMVSPPPPEPWKCLRVFVVFSGPAGAWRAIKELDGRFFGGRQLEVTYFDEARFMRGDRDGPLLTT